MKITYLTESKPVSHTVLGVTNIEAAVNDLMKRYNFFHEDIVTLEVNGKLMDVTKL